MSDDDDNTTVDETSEDSDITTGHTPAVPIYVDDDTERNPPTGG